MKKCFKCGIEKPLVEFYKHKMMGDGHLGKCKDCTKNDTKTRLDEKLKDPGFVTLEQQRHRDKYYRLNYKEKHKPTPDAKKRAMRDYVDRYPEKMSAKSRMNKVRSPTGFHFHHWSYKKEHSLDVIKIKHADHYTIHRFIEYDQPKMCYKTKSGVLLDTREKHIEHIRVVFELNGIEQYI